MSVKVGSARIDENGNARGGKAGDQTKFEVSTQNWYKHTKGWRVFRAKNKDVAYKIGEAMKMACENDNIGYDQNERNSLYTVASIFDFDISKVQTKCECDCSALVRVCCAYAGIRDISSDFRTVNMPKKLLDTGYFVELKGSKYTDQDAYLGKGDILVTKTSGHTVVVLTNGNKYDSNVSFKDYEPGERIIALGCEGNDVKIMQEYLIELGYNCGKYGADGDFGKDTLTALKKFQTDNKLEPDGEYGPLSFAKMIALIEKNKKDELTVSIINGNCYIRSKANIYGTKLGVAYKGSIYAYAGKTETNGWVSIYYNEEKDIGWVSGKYSKINGGTNK